MRRDIVGLIVLLAACGGDKNESASGSSSGEETGATLGMSSEPTGGGTEGTTVGSGVGATSAEATGAETSNGEVTSMGPTSADPSAGETGDATTCTMLCAKGETCMVDLGGDMCMQFCLMGISGG